MKSTEIRKNWIDYFQNKHAHLYQPSAPLIPTNPTLLLTNAGMLPFVPYFLGEKTPPHPRMVSIQKCARVGGKDSDLENIGRTPRHLSFFEMLGNFSFGDYFKEDVIPWAWQLLTEVYKIPAEDLTVTVFGGDERVTPDDEAAAIWHKKVGLPLEKIEHLGREDNFWGPPGGVSGPCGPCSEIMYRGVEIWNLVFMQYENLPDGHLQPLKKPNVDTGAGLERLACVLQGVEDVFWSDLLAPLVYRVQEILPPNHKDAWQARVIADHMRCVCMLLADGVRPGNLGRSYIVRMLLRRAARYGKLLNLEARLSDLLPDVQMIMAEAYPELQSPQLKQEIIKEEERFDKTLEQGLRKFEEILSRKNQISGEEAFELYATYGFPVELTLDLAQEHGLDIDLAAYEASKEKHAKVSNTNSFNFGFQSVEAFKSLPATEFVGYESDHLQQAKVLHFADDEIVLDKTPFYAESGGQLADTGKIYSERACFEVVDVQKISHEVFLHKGKYLSEETFNTGEQVSCQINTQRRTELRKHHTATHLLQAALRQVLGETVHQAGSQVSPDKLRFDFTHTQALSPQHKKQIQDLINNWIERAYPVETKLLTLEDALQKGALAFFGEKYDEKQVRVLKIGDVSVELCGGTHVSNTSEIGIACLSSEASVASGTRRIEMTVGQASLNNLKQESSILWQISSTLKTPPEKIPGKITELESTLQKQRKEISQLQQKLLSFEAQSLLNQTKTSSEGFAYLLWETDSSNLKILLDDLSNRLEGSYVLFVYNQQKSIYACACKGDNHKACDLVQRFAGDVGGKGGGREGFAQGGGGDRALYAQAIESMRDILS